MKLRRIVWLLVLAMVVLIIGMMLTVPTYPKWLDGARLIGSYLRGCANERC